MKTNPAVVLGFSGMNVSDFMKTSTIALPIAITSFLFELITAKILSYFFIKGNICAIIIPIKIKKHPNIFINDID